MKIKYSMGRTINLGNFENVKFDFGVELTCEEDDFEKTWEEAKSIITNKMKEEETEWTI